jgi:hypothetical protein
MELVFGTKVMKTLFVRKKQNAFLVTKSKSYESTCMMTLPDVILSFKLIVHCAVTFLVSFLAFLSLRYR